MIDDENDRVGLDECELDLADDELTDCRLVARAETARVDGEKSR